MNPNSARGDTKSYVGQYAANDLELSSGFRTPAEQLGEIVKISVMVMALTGLATKKRPAAVNSSARQTYSGSANALLVSRLIAKKDIQKTVLAQAGLLKHVCRRRGGYFVENSPATGSRPKSAFSLEAIESRLPLICGSE